MKNLQLIPIPPHKHRFQFLFTCLYLPFSKLKNEGTKEQKAKINFFTDPENWILIPFGIQGHLVTQVCLFFGLRNGISSNPQNWCS